jgi:PAS domain S-box-containing protein
VPDGVCAINTEGRIVTWNEGAVKMLGYRPEEIIGSPMQSILPPERADEEVRHCLDILNRDGSYSGYETTRIAKDGTEMPVEITAVALKEGGVIIGYAAVMRDVSGRKKAEQALRKSEEKYRDLFENASDMIFIVDPDLNYVDVNRRAVETVGFSKEELLSMSILDMIPPS